MPETEELDIIAELKKSTEPLADKKVSDSEMDDLLKGYSKAEFDEEEEEEEPETKDVEAEEVKDGPTAVPKEDKASNLRSAKRWVKTFNTLLKVTLPGLYAKKILHPGDADILKGYKKKKDLGGKKFSLEDAITEDDNLYQALQRFETLEQYIKEVPLTKEEMDDLAEPLAECIEKYKWMKVGPEGQLFMSVGIIMLPRLEPILPNFTSFIDRLFKERNKDYKQAA